MTGSGCFRATLEGIPCTGLVLEVQRESVVLCWRDSPGQLVHAGRNAFHQRVVEKNISLRYLLKTGDVVGMRVYLVDSEAVIRWTVVPNSLYLIKHTGIYEGVGEMVVENDNEGLICSYRGVVRYQKERCKFGSYGAFSKYSRTCDVSIAQDGDVSSSWPQVFDGDQMRFRAISMPDGTWGAVKVMHLFEDDLGDWRFPNRIGRTSTVVLMGREMPAFAKGLDGLTVTAVNNVFTPDNTQYGAGDGSESVSMSPCEKSTSTELVVLEL